MVTTVGYGAYEQGGRLAPITFERRDLRANDVQIDILYCGVCHSDLHQVQNLWNSTVYPLVPGHEIVGVVSAIGSSVSRYEPGQLVAVGSLVDSCRACAPCVDHQENYCEKGPVLSFNGRDRFDGSVTKGGFSKVIVVAEDYVLRMPQAVDAARFAPLLCAGITTYAPLRRYNVGFGTNLGVIGLGGLGHLAIKFGVALGAQVTLFTRSAEKAEKARQLGASTVVVSTDRAQMKTVSRKLDLILDTASQAHDVNPYLSTLKLGGNLVLAGALEPINPPPHGFLLAAGRRSVSGTFLGGIAETQEMLDFCAENGISADIELIPIQRVNEAFERLGDVNAHSRFVIDLTTFNGD